MGMGAFNKFLTIFFCFSLSISCALFHRTDLTLLGQAAHVLYMIAGRPGGLFGGDPVRQGVVSPCSVTNVKLTDVSGLGNKNTADSSQLLFFVVFDVQ